MSIEAMKQMIELYDKHSYNSDHGGIEFSKKHGYKFTEAVEALRTAIQQAEAQQPATAEPVLFIHPDTFAMNNAHVGAWKPGHELTGYIPLYTHPAPSGLGDSKRLDYLQDRGATIDLIAGVADFYPMRFRVGGLHSSANIDVRAAIDAAMLAPKDSK